MMRSGNISSDLSSSFSALSLTAGVKRGLSNKQKLEAPYFKETLPLDWQLGEAIDNGDSFYEALAYKINADRRPLDKIYALMSQQACHGERLKEGASLPNYPEWQIIFLHRHPSGYFGIIYVNHSDNQLVVAHGETHPLKDSYYEKISSLRDVAFRVAETAIQLAQSQRAHLSFTGYSVGAFLAGLCVFYCHQSFRPITVNAVTFESPDPWIIMQHRIPSNSNAPAIDNSQLDIIEYLTFPNWFNAYQSRVGTFYQIAVNDHNSDLLGRIDWVDGILRKTGILPLRHFQPAFRDFLIKFFEWRQTQESTRAIKEGLKKRKVLNVIIDHLLGYELINTALGVRALKLNKSGECIHNFRKMVSEWLAQNENIAKIAFVKLSFSSKGLATAKEKKEFKSILKNSNVTIEPSIIEKLKTAHNDRDYKTQSELYSIIAQFYLRGRDYISAITLYNFALGANNKWFQLLLEKKYCDISIFSNRRKQILCGINISEGEYLHSIGINFRLNRFPCEKVYHLHREYLTDLRRQVYEQLKSKRPLASIKEIYKHISSSIKEFIVILVKECIQVLGNPPCPYALIGLGSLARDEATPYSDFEFAILISNENCKPYFRHLAELINIKILNLGETSPKIAYVDKDLFSFSFDYDKNPVYKGFAFDSRDPSGCKLPLGNQHLSIPKEEQFELIQTPAAMSGYQSDYWFNKNRSLVLILNNVTFIMGSTHLVEQYRTLVQGHVTWWEREFRARLTLYGDIMKFEPRVGKMEKESRVCPVKYDLYRLPNLVFDALALYFELSSTNTIDRINELRVNNFLNTSIAQGLKDCFYKISKWRLKNYLEADEQEDNLVIGANQHKKRNKLIAIYKDLFYLWHCAYDFAMNGNNCFESDDLKMDNFLAEIRIHEKLFGNSKVIEICRTILDSPSTNSDKNIDVENRIVVASKLGIAYFQQDRFKKAESIFKKLIKAHPGNPGLHANYALALDGLGQYEKALEQLSLAKETLKYSGRVLLNITLLDNSYPGAEILSRMGIVLQHAGRYQEAMEYLSKAVAQETSAYPGVVTPSLLNYQNNLANILIDMGEFKKAYDLYDRFIESVKNQFGTSHPNVARGLYNKAEAFIRQGRYQEALECNQKALQIYYLESNNEHSSELSHIFSSMTTIYAEQEQNGNENASKYANLALQANIKLFGENHRTTILSYFAAIRTYDKMKIEREAINLFKRVKKFLFRESNHDLKAQLYGQISDLFLYLANAKNKKQYLKKALSYAEKAINIVHLLFEKERCVKYLNDLANCLNNKGVILTDLKEYNSAEECFNESLKNLKVFFKNDKHFFMVKYYLNIGSVYLNKNCGDSHLCEALKYFRKALKVQMELYGNSEHGSLAKTYAFVSNAFYLLGELDEAWHYIQKSREVRAKFNLKIDESSENLFQKILKELRVGNPSLHWSFTLARLKRAANKKLIEDMEKTVKKDMRK